MEVRVILLEKGGARAGRSGKGSSANSNRTRSGSSRSELQCVLEALVVIEVVEKCKGCPRGHQAMHVERERERETETRTHRWSNLIHNQCQPVQTGHIRIISLL